MIDFVQQIVGQEYLVNLTIKSSFILGLSGLINWALRRYSAAIRHWIWSLAFCSILFIPILSVVLPAWQLPVLPHNPALDIMKHENGRPFQASFDEQSAQAIPSPDLSVDTDKPALSSPPFPGNLSEMASRDDLTDLTFWTRIPWLAVVWGLGTAYLLLRMLAELTCLLWIFHRGAPLTNPTWTATLDRFRSDLGIRRKVRVVASEHLSVPVTFGLLRPIILVPQQARGWPDKQRRLVLLHELTHVKRLDYLPNLVAQVVSAVFWFNPIVWLAARQLYLEREMASDDCVLATGTANGDYAKQLLTIAQGLFQQGNLGTRTIAMAQQSNLRKRLQHIMSHRTRRHPITRFSALVSLAVVMLLIVPLAVMHLQNKSDLDTAMARSYQNSVTISDLIADLQSSEVATQKKAAWSLGEREDGKAVDALLQALQDNAPEVRAMAAWALGEIKDPQAIPDLITALSDSDVYAREMVVKALGEIGKDSAIAPLQGMLKDPNPGVRHAAVWALGEIPAPQAQQSILSALDDPSDRVRKMAVTVLAYQMDGPGVSALEMALQDRNPNVRASVAHALGARKGPQFVGALVEVLTDSNASVRLEAAQALGKIGKPEAVDALIDLLRDQDPDVRAMATWALDEISLQ